MDPLLAIVLALRAAARYEEAARRRCHPCMHLWWLATQDMVDQAIESCTFPPAYRGRRY